MIRFDGLKRRPSWPLTGQYGLLAAKKSTDFVSFVDPAKSRLHGPEMLTKEQSLVARVLLQWRQIDVAERTDISERSIRRFEAGESLEMKSMRLLRATYEAAGIVFIDPTENSGPGAYLRDPVIAR